MDLCNDFPKSDLLKLTKLPMLRPPSFLSRSLQHFPNSDLLKLTKFLMLRPHSFLWSQTVYGWCNSTHGILYQVLMSR
ncbi:hypothetical protein U1Q18_025550 [Sarracenia purpurea var. burkii]